MRKFLLVPAIALTVAAFSCVLKENTPRAEITSKAYAGHENDRDIDNFIQQYPESAGSRLDDCQTCHRGGVAETDTEREFSSCGYCHLIVFPNARYKTGVPENYEETLNSFGMAYKQKGRTIEALKAIEELDSDGDGYSNGAEITQTRYPGESSSRPGQPQAPFVTLNRDRIRSLPRHTQFMLMNRTTQQFDVYTSYSGILVKDLLDAAGADLTDVVGITVFAPDGYSIDYTMEDVLKPFPMGYFYAEPNAITDKEKSFVDYPATVPPDVVDGREIPGSLWLLLAFEQNRAPLDISRYEKGTGHLVGEGPYRLIMPQRDILGDISKPGRPDRSVKSGTYGDGWDYLGAIDHNAGNCVRGACVIRLNPMPGGYEEYDWKNGWPLIKTRQIVIFGRGVSGNH